MGERKLDFDFQKRKNPFSESAEKESEKKNVIGLNNPGQMVKLRREKKTSHFRWWS